MDRRNYMELLSEQIRCKRALPLVTKELELHIEEQKSDFMAEGMTEREAEEMAVREMGDPVEVGAAMDRIHRPKMNWRMIFGIGLVSLCGTGLLYALDIRVEQKGMPFFYMGQLLYMVIGFGLMIGVCCIDYTRIAYRAKALLAGYIVFFLGTYIFGVTINGARGFINLFGSFINVNQWMILVIPLYCAILYSYSGQGRSGFIKSILWSFPVIVLELMFRMSQLMISVPALAVILSIAVCKGYFRVPVKKTLAGIWSVVLLLPAAGAFMIIKFGAEYQAMRLKVMIEPSKYAYEEGFQFFTTKKLLEGSKFIGQGANFSEYSGNVPDCSSFVLTYVVSYFGVLAAVCVVSVLAVLLFKLTAMTVKQKNRLGLLMGAGCGVTIVIQAAWYILTNLGIVLLGPVYCPFITYGGSGMIVTYILFGIMLSIYRYQNIAVEEPRKRFVRKKCQE